MNVKVKNTRTREFKHMIKNYKSIELILFSSFALCPNCLRDILRLTAESIYLCFYASKT